MHGRTFPWREPETTPFGILMAEMLLRQTQASMVGKTWPGLIDRYPDPAAVLMSQDEDLYNRLAVLGFGNQRVVAVKSMSRALVDQHAGRVPRSIPRLLELPHVGLYAAHATACFAFGRRVPVVDSNVLRVFSRLSGEDYGQDIRRGMGRKAWKVAWLILPKRNARAHNYGLLDFAAQVCKPRIPVCSNCPLTSCCAYYQRLQLIE